MILLVRPDKCERCAMEAAEAENGLDWGLSDYARKLCELPKKPCVVTIDGGYKKAVCLDHLGLMEKVEPQSPAPGWRPIP